jgi:hypothetical protein
MNKLRHENAMYKASVQKKEMLHFIKNFLVMTAAQLTGTYSNEPFTSQRVT